MKRKTVIVFNLDQHRLYKLTNEHIKFFNLEIKFTDINSHILFLRLLYILKDRINRDHKSFWKSFHSLRKALWIIENLGGIIKEKVQRLYHDYNTDQLQNIRKKLSEDLETMRSFIKLNYINIVKINDFPYMRVEIRDFFEWIFPDVVKEISDNIIPAYPYFGPRRFSKIEIDISRRNNINLIRNINDLSCGYYDQDWENAVLRLNFTDKGIFPIHHFPNNYNNFKVLLNI